MDEYEALNIHVVPVKTGYLNLRGWYRVYKVFQAGNWDAVCDLTGNFSGIYMFLAYLAGVRNRVAYFGQSTNHFKEAWYNLFYNWCVNRLIRKYASSVVSNSVSAFNFFFGIYWQNDPRFHIVHNGVDTSAFKKGKAVSPSIRNEFNIPDGAFLVAHSGRLDEKKNHKAVINLAKKLADEYPQIYFVLCGKDTEKLRPECKEAGLSSRVFTIGFRTDVNQVLRESDAFYFPSYTEGQPNALIEAMVAGLPFVASNIEPIRETVPEAYWGQLVEPDDIHSASEKVIEILRGQNKKDFEALSSWASEHYSPADRFGEFSSILFEE